MATYLIYNQGNKEEHEFLNGESDEDIKHKIINNFDLSKIWVFYSLNYLLKTYNKICDSQDFDYEFHDMFDIINNYRGYTEILSLMDRFPDIKIEG